MGPGNLRVKLKYVSLMSADDDDDASLFVFLSRFLDHQNGIVNEETRKLTSEKWYCSEYVHRAAPNLGPEPRLVWFAMALLSSPQRPPICFLTAQCGSSAPRAAFLLAAGRLLNRAERLYEPRHQVKMCDETNFLLQVVQLWKCSSSAQ